MSGRTDRWQQLRQRVEQALAARIPAPDRIPGRLHEAMRYSCLGGGKRLRAILVYTTGEMFGVPPHVLDVPASAVELIHAYSLVHDDLPSMDDDDLRRGRPTCHRAFDDATAILAGDALQDACLRPARVGSGFGHRAGPSTADDHDARPGVGFHRNGRGTGH